MNVVPIQVTDEGVLIPKSYLHDADDVEVVVEEDYVLVRPKRHEVREKGRRYSFIASGHTRNPRASAEAEEILEREVDRSHGWTVDS
ncbi:MAG: hypothetical protein U0641_17810 [Anaerolineae bacterium]